MAYIGRDPLYGTFEKQVLVPNGTDTLFELDFISGSTGSLLIVESGAVKNPDVDYILAEGGRKIQFSSAPQNTFYIIFLGKQFLVPNFGKRFSVIQISQNVIFSANELPDILSITPLGATRTITLPIPQDVAGYQVIVANKSSEQSLSVSYGLETTLLSPNTSVTLVSDSLSWFVAS